MDEYKLDQCTFCKQYKPLKNGYCLDCQKLIENKSEKGNFQDIWDSLFGGKK